MEWRYVRSEDNPADDVTRGLPVSKLGKGSRWTDGPGWLHDPQEEWQKDSACILAQTRVNSIVEQNEIKSVFCGLTVPTSEVDVDFTAFSSWTELISAVGRQLYPDDQLLDGILTPEQTHEVEILLLRKAQSETFKEEVGALSSNRELSRNSRLLELAPELDPVNKLIRVGGRLRKASPTDRLDPHHPVTKLLIKDADAYFSHKAGTDQVFAHFWRPFWIFRGRRMVKGILHACPECRRWRGTPRVPRMGDLPECKLRLEKPPFYSTGVDCFGPLTVKIGRRQEKRWGLLFKCMTTRAVHLDILESLDADNVLMAYRRFASRQGVPFELLSDCGTNF
ncbi:uncharacterized protein LOC110989997 [Acanthaster planci]|uniref:Uncharacterized protein LOC110989997 n=1 Tax=Acanthaster planci TaxID=133434 RepID=A0A8B8A3H3_ACAPL|nr:uncharacterized protein LOC110989997 [Acanthaster planci]